MVNELFGEVNVPILKDLQFAKLLEIDGSARYTHYRSYGSGFTYHFNAQWAPISGPALPRELWDLVPCTQSLRAERREPNGLLSGHRRSLQRLWTNTSPGSVVYQNCLAALTPILGANAPNFINTGSILVTTTGGGRNLKAEHSKAWGFGGYHGAATHRRSHFCGRLLGHQSEGRSQQLGNTLLDLCYDLQISENVYCSFIGARSTAAPIGARLQPSQSLH